MAINETEWTLLPFDQLPVTDLYDLMKLRSEVFVVEQNCVYLDPDDKDQLSYHLYKREQGIIAAYARLMPPGVSYKDPSIGRVVSNPRLRGSGEGRKLMEKAIISTYELFGGNSIHIGAQQYLLKFYRSLGFREIGEVYLEDGIPHLEMIHTK